MAGVKFKGLRETIRAMEKLGVSVADLKGAIANVSNRAVREAQSLTPVRSGALRNSVRASKAKNKAVIRAGTARVNYASFVEYGSVHNRAVGMVTKAVKASEQYAPAMLDKELQDLIRRYGLD